MNNFNLINLSCYLNNNLNNTITQYKIYGETLGEDKLVDIEYINKFDKFNLNKFIDKSLYEYIFRITKYLNCDLSCYVYTIIYMDSIITKHPDIYLIFDIYSLFVFSLLSAYKFVDDNIKDNIFFSKLTGIHIEDLNKLEMKYLVIIKYDLFIDNDTFIEYLKLFPIDFIQLINKYEIKNE